MPINQIPKFPRFLLERFAAAPEYLLARAYAAEVAIEKNISIKNYRDFRRKCGKRLKSKLGKAVANSSNLIAAFGRPNKFPNFAAQKVGLSDFPENSKCFPGPLFCSPNVSLHGFRHAELPVPFFEDAAGQHPVVDSRFQRMIAKRWLERYPIKRESNVMLIYVNVEIFKSQLLPSLETKPDFYCGIELTGEFLKRLGTNWQLPDRPNRKPRVSYDIDFNSLDDVCFCVKLFEMAALVSESLIGCREQTIAVQVYLDMAFSCCTAFLEIEALEEVHFYKAKNVKLPSVPATPIYRRGMKVEVCGKPYAVFSGRCYPFGEDDPDLHAAALHNACDLFAWKQDYKRKNDAEIGIIIW